MDRNSLIGLFLIGLIMFGTFLFMPEQKPPEKSQETEERVKDNQPEEEEPGTQDTRQEPASPDRPDEVQEDREQTPAATEGQDPSKDSLPGVFSGKNQGKEKTVTLENEHLKLRLSNKGGRIVYAEVKDHKRYDGSPLVLIDSQNTDFGYRFFYENQRINTDDLYFRIEGDTGKVSGDQPKTVRMVLKLGEDRHIAQEYTLSQDGHMLDYDLGLVGMNEVIPRNTRYLDLSWICDVRQQEKNLSQERRKTSPNFKYANDDASYLSQSGSSSQEISSNLKWVSFKQQFFTQVLIAEESSFERGVVETEEEPEMDHVETSKTTLTIPFEHERREQFDMQMYLGPTHYQTLNNYGMELEEQIGLGWGIFGWINKFLIIPVFNFLDNYIASYGIIIILLTILIKVILTPLTYKSFMSQAKMKALKPDIDQLKEKHGNDMQKMQMEQMKLYRKAGINPMGGCLPMLLQLPFLIAMFHFYPSSIELRQEAFLWANDLSTYDSIWNFPGGFSIPFYGDHVSLFTLLMAGSTMLYSWYNQQMTPTSNDQMGQQMKIMTYIMPFFILFIFNSYSAGLSCYYFFYNILSFLQQYSFKFMVDEDKIHQQIQERKKKPAAEKSKFQQRLEDMTKKQQEMKQQQPAKSKNKNKKRK